MDAGELQSYIYEHIPVIAQNHFEIQEIKDEQVFFKGSLKEHINHRDSAFGGSLSSLMILTAWSAVRIMTDKLKNVVIVIQNSHVDFLKPVLADFTAVNHQLPPAIRQKLFQSLQRFGKGRVTMNVDLYTNDPHDILASFKGDFVVVQK